MFDDSRVIIIGRYAHISHISRDNYYGHAEQIKSNTTFIPIPYK